jgi:hypothetical protein
VLVQVSLPWLVVLEAPPADGGLSPGLQRVLDDPSVTKVLCDGPGNADKTSLGLPVTGREDVVELEDLAAEAAGPARVRRGLARILSLGLPGMPFRVAKQTKQERSDPRSDVMYFARVEQGKQRPPRSLSEVPASARRYAAMDAWCTLLAFDSLKLWQTPNIVVAPGPYVSVMLGQYTSEPAAREDASETPRPPRPPPAKEEWERRVWQRARERGDPVATMFDQLPSMNKEASRAQRSERRERSPAGAAAEANIEPERQTEDISKRLRELPAFDNMSGGECRDALAGLCGILPHKPRDPAKRDSVSSAEKRAAGEGGASLVGREVIVQGLVKGVKYNGRAGVILGTAPGSGRLQVRLHGSPESSPGIALKRENLRVLEGFWGGTRFPTTIGDFANKTAFI